MPKFQRNVLIISLVLIFIGSWLPWVCFGDIPRYCEKGIEIFSLSALMIDNGSGIFVIFLSFIIAGLVYYQPVFLKNSNLWALIGSIILLIYTASIFGFWVLRSIQEKGIFGAATPAIGIELVLLGAIALTLLTLFRYRTDHFQLR